MLKLPVSTNNIDLQEQKNINYNLSSIVWSIKKIPPYNNIGYFWCKCIWLFCKHTLFIIFVLFSFCKLNWWYLKFDRYLGYSNNEFFCYRFILILTAAPLDTTNGPWVKWVKITPHSIVFFLKERQKNFGKVNIF